MRSTKDAFAYIQQQAGRRTYIGVGKCMYNARLAYDIPAAGDVDRDGDADAVDGRKTATLKRLTPAQCPRGGFIWWSGGSNGFGHVAIPRGDGTCWTPGSPDTPGYWDVMAIDDVTRRWNLTWEGWSPNFNGVTVYVDPPKPPPPAPVEMTRGPNVDATIAAAERIVTANQGKTGAVAKARLAAAAATLKALRALPQRPKKARR